MNANHLQGRMIVPEQPHWPGMRHLTIVFITAFLLSAGTIRALEADRHEPINIQADSALVNEKEGTSIYTGDVTIDQGTLHIAAHQVEIVTDGERVIQIIATAEADSEALAHYEQKPGPEDATVYADARKITYFVQEERLHLAGSASLRQNQDKFSGELLYYDVNEGTVNLTSSGEEGDRVKMTINPRKE
ncbi:MAG: lipopolysaccharide transport periplasmic protein LptA [Pseudomonadales bacterium]|nr:lipopolysaccharide transport periplasmic protein LptA [Pseudomonadales bacterium]